MSALQKGRTRLSLNKRISKFRAGARPVGIGLMSAQTVAINLVAGRRYSYHLNRNSAR